MQNNLFFEMLPLAAFFIVYYITKNLYIATAICIIASWIQLIFCKLKFKHVSKNTWISTILITIFGGLTIVLHNKTFVMLKPTVLLWIIGVSMLIGQAVGKNGIKLMLQKEISLPDQIWGKLNLAWGLFFIVMGFINIFVAFNFSEYVWVKYKVFGSMALTIMFMLITVVFAFILQKRYKKQQ
jgi:intracellular septation protein